MTTRGKGKAEGGKAMKEPSCAKCGAAWGKLGMTNCWSGDPKAAPPRPGNCPSGEDPELLRDSFRKYSGSGEDARMARTAAKVEGLCYRPVPGSDAVNARWTRVEDTVAFAKLMGYRKIGVATCIGLLDEAERLCAILSAQGLSPLSVCCKAGSIDKLELGLSESDKVRPGTFEPACNPVAQARILDRCGAEMSVIVGLCVGHDMLFAKHSKAPVTTLVVKDRVTGHNPVAALYGQNFYYKRLQRQPVLPEEGAVAPSPSGGGASKPRRGGAGSAAPRAGAAGKGGGGKAAKGK